VENLNQSEIEVQLDIIKSLIGPAVDSVAGLIEMTEVEQAYIHAKFFKRSKVPIFFG